MEASLLDDFLPLDGREAASFTTGRQAQLSATQAEPRQKKHIAVPLVGVALVALASTAIYAFMHNSSESQARAGVVFLRERLLAKQTLGRRDALAVLRASKGRAPARKLLGTRAEVQNYLMALNGFVKKTEHLLQLDEICPDEDVRVKLRANVRRSDPLLERAQWVALFPCILEIAITDPDQRGRRRQTNLTWDLINREPWLALGGKKTTNIEV